MEPLRELEDGGGQRDLVVVGASAGGVEALRQLVADLPYDLPAAICVVLHLAPGSPSALAGILERAGPLPCRFAGDDQPLRAGEILVAPPDHHVVVEDGRVRLTVGPRENGHRPAVDVLFRTAAAARDSRVVGVILSGTRDDGAAGMAVIKQEGGATVVQSPDDAMYPGMPSTALANVNVDAVVPAEIIGKTIASIVKGEEPPVGSEPHVPPDDPETGRPLTSVCPECGGVLQERAQAGASFWECHVGHRYSPSSFDHAQAQEVEAALWTAVRMLKDRGALLHRMGDQFEGRAQMGPAERFRRRAEEAYRQSELVREALTAAAGTTLRQVDEREDEQAAGARGGA